MRGPFSTFGISDHNVERALSGSWPLEPPKPNRVVRAKGSSMFPVDRTAIGLAYALRHLAFGVPRGLRPRLEPGRGLRNLSRILTFITLFQVRERMKTQFALALVELTHVPPEARAQNENRVSPREPLDRNWQARVLTHPGDRARTRDRGCGRLGEEAISLVLRQLRCSNRRGGWPIRGRSSILAGVRRFRGGCGLLGRRARGRHARGNRRTMAARR